MPFAKDRFYWLLAALGVLAGLLAAYQMRWGPWAFSDSAAYIAAARNLAEGNGLSIQNPSGVYRPLTLHQPLYPFVLAFLVLLGVHPFTTTQALNIVCFGASVFVLGAGAYSLTRSRVLALLLAGCMLIFPPILDNFGGAMSEPLYLALTLAGFICIQAHIANGSQRMLYASAALTGLSMLTRHVGIANIAASALILLSIPRMKSVQRLKAVGLFAGLAALPSLLWQLTLPTGLAGRSFALADTGPRAGEFWGELSAVLSSWLPVAGNWPAAAELRAALGMLLGLLALLTLAIASWQALHRNEPVQVLTAFVLSAGLFALVYTLVSFAAYAFSNITPDINSRTMLPLFPFLLILAWGGLLRTSKPASLVAVAGLAAFALLAWAPAARILLGERRELGLGYTSPYYRSSLVLRAARDLPRDIPWISNEPALFLLYLNKFPYDLSTIYPEILQANNPPLGEGGTELDRLFREENAYFLLYEQQFRARLGESALPNLDNLTRGLEVIHGSDEGKIYVYPAD